MHAVTAFLKTLSEFGKDIAILNGQFQHSKIYSSMFEALDIVMKKFYYPL